jgi:cell wall-associated NlpC family hydrolase
MSVLLYQPGIWMHIQSSDGKQTIYDVSDDIVSGTITLTENQSHKMQITLLNPGRKYDKLFKPNDRFVIWLKRLTKLQIMSGYLDTVPFFSVWPRSITITGSSTLKRLQYRFWDPGDTASFNLFEKLASGGNSSSTSPVSDPTNPDDQQTYNDSGIGRRIMALLTGYTSADKSSLVTVPGGPGGWDPSTVHISALPNDWVNTIKSLFDQIAPQLHPSPIAALSTDPLVAGQNAFTSSAALQGSTGPNGDGSDGAGSVTPPVGADLPTSSGHATLYSGDQDIQPSSSFYCQMQWRYRTVDGTPVDSSIDVQSVKNYLMGQKLMVYNGQTNESVVVSIAGWGPSPDDPDGSIIGLSQDAYNALGLQGSGVVEQGKPDNSNPITASVSIAWIAKPDATSTGTFNVTTSNQSTAGPAVPVTRSPRKWAVDDGPPPQTTVPPIAAGASAPGQVGTVAQGAVAFALAQVGKPYVWGGTGPPQFDGYDCSGLMQAAYNSQGVKIPRTSMDQYANAVAGNQMSIIPGKDQATWLAGDLIFYPGSDGTAAAPGHVLMYIGDGQTVEAPSQGQLIRQGPVYDLNDGTNGIVAVARVTGSTGPGTGVVATGTGTTLVSTVNQGSNTTTTLGGLAIVQGPDGNFQVSDTSSQSSTSFITQWQWMEASPDPESLALFGYRALMNDVPLLPMIETMCQASMRSFCSAPNGDFIAWFPDYFNVYGCLGEVNISDIELQDFTVNWSDLSMITHQFAVGNYASNTYSTDLNNPAGAVGIVNMMFTGGVATIDFPAILQELFHLSPDDSTFSKDAIYQRFGARPDFQQMGTLVGPVAEFWYALYRFQYNWATQFAAQVPICFMPELYPGMIMKIPSQGFQAYVQ